MWQKQPHERNLRDLVQPNQVAYKSDETPPPPLPEPTALCLLVDYGELNKRTQNHSGTLPNMENTLERIL